MQRIFLETPVEVRVTRLVILPGLDGTGTLHEDFIAALGTTFATVQVMAYPADAVLDYPSLERRVRAALPDQAPFVLLGESFSGPLAIAIAADPPANLRGLVLSATFARAPVPLSRLLAPITRVAPVHGVPLAVLRWWLLGRWSSPALDRALRRALRQVSPQVLRHRAGLAMRVDVVGLLHRIPVPVVYLRASGDRLLAAGAGRLITRNVADCTCLDMQGPHLLLQAAAPACAAAVKAQAMRLGWVR